MSDIKLLRGDCVIVKNGVLDPDLQFDIGGWQGRILEPEQSGIVIIAWDSLTLKRMGMDLIVRCENENLDWELIGLSPSELIKTDCRDMEEDVSETVAAIRAKLLRDPRVKDRFLH